MTNLCVYGLWHLGSVTAACMAEHFPTVGIDPDPAVIDGLRDGRPPISEPGLEELIRRGRAAARMEFSADVARVATADVVWVTFDTPVDEDDRADVESVVRHVERLFPHLADGAVVLLSSQVPVGTTARLEAAFAAVAGGRGVAFACSPENLRLGKAIEVFRTADRIVVGTRTPEARGRLEALLAPLGRPILWVSTESAEMTKHAVNAFLATSVVFINELAAACEATGADAKEVERGLKTESRIGPGAYLGPGAAFAGGTLARDVAFLLGMGERLGFSTPLLAGVKQSNDVHRGWARRRLTELLGPCAARRSRSWASPTNPAPTRSVARSRWRSAAGASKRGRSCARMIRQLTRPSGSRPRSLAGPLDLVWHGRRGDRGGAGRDRRCRYRVALLSARSRPTGSLPPPPGPWSSTPTGFCPLAWRRTPGSAGYVAGGNRQEEHDAAP